MEKGTAFSYDFFLHMIQIIKRNQILVTAVLDNIQNSSFFRNVVSYFRHKYICSFEKDAPGLERKEAESLFTYILSGSIGIISDWIRGKEDEPEEEIAGRISRLNAPYRHMFCKAVQKTGIRYNFLNTKQILRRKTPRFLCKGDRAGGRKNMNYSFPKQS